MGVASGCPKEPEALIAIFVILAYYYAKAELRSPRETKFCCDVCCGLPLFEVGRIFIRTSYSLCLEYSCKAESQWHFAKCGFWQYYVALIHFIAILSSFLLKFAMQSSKECIYKYRKRLALIPTKSNRQFKGYRSSSETLALAIIWVSAQTIAVRAVITLTCSYPWLWRARLGDQELKEARTFA